MNVVKINMANDLISTNFFDLWPQENKLAELNSFIASLTLSEIVIFATFDDSAVHLDQETRRLIANLGSGNIEELSFRDSWAFIGSKKNLKFNESRTINNPESNAFNGWPKASEIKGCILDTVLKA